MPVTKIQASDLATVITNDIAQGIADAAAAQAAGDQGIADAAAAVVTADAAAVDAAAAVVSADTAQADAAAAVITADAAQLTADAAQTDATQALADALAAQTDATQALADAANAQATADAIVIPTFVTGEVMGGTPNDVLTDFTIVNGPSPVDSLAVYKNGLRQRLTDDYSLSSTTITFVVPPETDSNLLADYRY